MFDFSAPYPKQALTEIEMTKNVLLHALSHASLSIRSSHILIISGDNFFRKVSRRLRSLGYNSFIVVPNDAKMEFFDDPDNLIEERKYIWWYDSLLDSKSKEVLE